MNPSHNPKRSLPNRHRNLFVQFSDHGAVAHGDKDRGESLMDGFVLIVFLCAVIGGGLAIREWHNDDE